MDNNEQLESVLKQYRPAAPPDHLRRKTLETGSRQNPEKPIFRWMALAAVLMASVTLDLAGNAINRRNATMLDNKDKWNSQTEIMVSLIGRNQVGHEYIAIQLAAGDFSTPICVTLPGEVK